MRLTIACPEAHVGDANDLAMVLAYSPMDSLTYGDPTWQDEAGNKFSVCSAPVGSTFVSDALGTLARPEWDVTPYVISMAAARRAQALVVLGDETSAADPAHILAVAGDNGLAVLADMGLTRVEVA